MSFSGMPASSGSRHCEQTPRLALHLRPLTHMAQVQESGGTGGEARGGRGLGKGEVAVKGAAKRAPGAQFEISIDGTPRTYRDRKAFAIEAASHGLTDNRDDAEWPRLSDESFAASWFSPVPVRDLLFRAKDLFVAARNYGL